MSHGGNCRVVKVADFYGKTLNILSSSLDVCVFPSRSTVFLLALVGWLIFREYKLETKERTSEDLIK